MKKLIFAFTFLFSLSSFAGISIVSDLDDTIKITNSDKFWPRLGYGIARRKVYTGMPQFLAGSRSYVSRLNLVTSSPKVIQWNIKKLLRKHDIQVDNIVLNGNLHREDHVTFKTAAIKKIIEASEDQFIFLGDDVAHDPEIYDQIMKEYPDRVLGIYIHLVHNRPVPPTSQTFFTAYELSVKEHLAGRLSQDSVRQVAKAILASRNDESLFPDFAYCPKDPSYYAWLNDTEFKTEAAPLIERMIDYCKNHGHDDKKSYINSK